MTFEVVVLGQDACTDQFLLESGDVIQKILRCAATDIVNGVGRQREAVFACLLLGRALHDAENAFDDIGDVGEVALHVAVVEDLDCAALGERVGGREIEHVRAACGTVNGEEAEAGGRNIVELAIAVCQELVGLFSGRVEGDRVVDFVFHCEGHFFVAAVDGGTGGVDKVLDACVGGVPRGRGLAGEFVGVSAGFEDVVEADQVALDVNVRVVDRVTDARLRGEVHDDIGSVCLENAVDQFLVGDAALDEYMPDRGLDRVDHAETVFLELRVVVIVHVVETDHGSAGELAAQAHDKVGADEAGGAGDQDGLAVEVDGGFAHCCPPWVPCTFTFL